MAVAESQLFLSDTPASPPPMHSHRLPTDIWQRVWSFCDTEASMTWTCVHVDGKRDAVFFSRCVLTRLVLGALCAIRQRRECMNLQHPDIESVCMTIGGIRVMVQSVGDARVCVSIAFPSPAMLGPIAGGVNCAFGIRRLLPLHDTPGFMFRAAATSACCLVTCGKLILNAHPVALGPAPCLPVHAKLHTSPPSHALIIRARAAIGTDGLLECVSRIDAKVPVDCCVK